MLQHQLSEINQPILMREEAEWDSLIFGEVFDLVGQRLFVGIALTVAVDVDSTGLTPVLDSLLDLKNNILGRKYAKVARTEWRKQLEKRYVYNMNCENAVFNKAN